MRASPGSTPNFAGAAYDPNLDRRRLGVQIERIRSYMLGAGWRTLLEIRRSLEAFHSPSVFPESSVSAQLRNLRKRPYCYRLQRRRRAGVHGPGAGIWEYALLPPAQLEFEVLAKKTGPAVDVVYEPAVDVVHELDDGRGREKFFEAARRIVASLNQK